ncbi:PP2C family protein-serine/threonine phosphatase [Candidatus Viridilinea mediisalina]|uniref:PPM-type phosphatase domain-containing protein n=1 Tax=Candidatus Viridilinea mediisalina TaxID=2024553 RepID=A0A2A6RKV1_9CHLR|nr:PP2C family protein-serine/threonine phosphatase [Candidatus Viridilinea mediisalina]PDW03541.1 hypothetical protein CJ255_08220 [Candidatus Viridilinea mediisalina]
MLVQLQHYIARRWPDHAPQDETQQQWLLTDLLGILILLPFCLVGGVWLLLVTDLALLATAWLPLVTILIFSLLLTHRPFHWIIDWEATSPNSASATLSSLAHLSAVLIFGVSAIWIYVITLVVLALTHWWNMRTLIHRVSVINNMLRNLGGYLLGCMLGLQLYAMLGGSHPPLAETLEALKAFVLIGSVVLMRWCWLALMVALPHWLGLRTFNPKALRRYMLFASSIALPDSFAVLMAIIYSQSGFAIYVVLLCGVLLVSQITYRLSQAVEERTQRSRELTQLEQLSLALLEAPPEVASLPSILKTHVPAMFRHEVIEIRLGSEMLLHTPVEAAPLPAEAWAWLQTQRQPQIFRIGQVPPWSKTPLASPLILVPLDLPETGGIALSLLQASSNDQSILPAIHSLATQIMAAVRQAELYSQAVARQRMAQELELAGQIQQSFLPRHLPTLPGWQLSATLRPARETSGDFYDLLTLPNGRLGLLIADVADKGTGAALIMALSRTLLRTYAQEYPERPDLVLNATNQRLIAETDGTMFITLFYAVLEPESGQLCYSNAGHNPPLLLRQNQPLPPERLMRTGIPLGVELEQHWSAKTITLEHGDRLILYTDGITEAQDNRTAMFGFEGLIETVSTCTSCSAATLAQTILAAVAAFVGDAPQSDDLTLVVVTRGPG